MTREAALKVIGKFLGKYEPKEDGDIVSLNFPSNVMITTKCKVWELAYEDVFRVADVIKSKQFEETAILAKFNNKFLTYSK
jgi:hypothetical protein